MAIETLAICDWSNRMRRDVDTADPSWDQVEVAIRALNNRELNDIYLMPSKSNPETYLAVGGGDGRYFVTGSIDNERFPTLVDPKKAGHEQERLTFGGQEILISSQWVVGLDAALEAARRFYETGTFNCGVEWQFV